MPEARVIPIDARRTDPPPPPSDASSLEEKIASGLAFLRRRLTGDYEVDEFGFDPELNDNVLMAALRPLRLGLGPSRGLVTQGYVIALGEVAVGASLATLFVARWPPIVEDWARIKPAHAWFNLVDFVSLVIATTLLHFFPTVVGARTRRPAQVAQGTYWRRGYGDARRAISMTCHATRSSIGGDLDGPT